MPLSIAVAGIVFLAVFTQSFLGFGSVMVAMALLPGVIGLPLATPLFSALLLVFQPVLAYRYRRELNFAAVRPLVLGSLFGVPFGVFMLRYLDERIMLPVLGFVLLGYGLFALSSFRVPEFRWTGWAYIIGWIAGALGGAYVVTGPPVIVYAHGKQWPPAAFKANLQAYFIITTVVIVVGHVVNGSFVPGVWPLFWVSLPAAFLGMGAGFWLDLYVRPQTFRKAVLAGVILLGLGLVF